jgi:hypothetical protein
MAQTKRHGEPFLANIRAPAGGTAAATSEGVRSKARKHSTQHLLVVGVGNPIAVPRMAL